MNLMWAIYWTDVLENVGFFIFALTVIVTFASIIVTGALIEFHGEREEVSRYWKKAGPLLLLGFLITCFIPSQKTMYAMLVANAGQQIVDNPKMQEIGGNALKILNDKLQELAGDEKGSDK